MRELNAEVSMRKISALFVAIVFACSTALAGCERKDVKEEMDGDEEKVMQNEDGDETALSPDPEEASEELPGVPEKMPDRPGAAED